MQNGVNPTAFSLFGVRGVKRRKPCLFILYEVGSKIRKEAGLCTVSTIRKMNGNSLLNNYKVDY